MSGREILRTAMLAGVALALAGPAAADTLRARLNADIRSTDPGVNRDANTDAVVLHMVEGLVAFREDASVGPLLAESMTVTDDGRTYTFRLREGVRFHNGATLSAEDVAWTWRRYMTPETRWRCLTEFDGRGVTKLDAVETPDPRTVVFRFARASALISATMARPDCGGAGILPGEDRPPKGEALTGRLYFERQPPEMRAAIGLPMSGPDDEAPPEDDEAEAARLSKMGEEWERFLERKRGGTNHHIYGAASTIAATEAARGGKAAPKARSTRQAGQRPRA